MSNGDLSERYLNSLLTCPNKALGELSIIETISRTEINSERAKTKLEKQTDFSGSAFYMTSVGKWKWV